ncbi:MAG: 2-oxoacid:acceptor oxidoreductase family protein [Syntrophaceae bacterium]
MKQQIIVSGLGGQGVIFMTRVLAEAAMAKGFDVLTSETHGMAMRGGTVISHIKIGNFKSPLIRQGMSDIGLFLNKTNLEVHRDLMKRGGTIFVNTDSAGDYRSIDATDLAKEAGSPVIANLVLLGYAVKEGYLFCSADEIEEVIQRISPPKQREQNIKGIHLGLRA